MNTNESWRQQTEDMLKNEIETSRTISEKMVLYCLYWTITFKPYGRFVASLDKKGNEIKLIVAVVAPTVILYIGVLLPLSVIAIWKLFRLIG